MRRLLLVPAFALATLLLPGSAMAGEGCAHGEKAAVTASTGAAAGHDGHAGGCTACAHAAAAGEKAACAHAGSGACTQAAKAGGCAHCAGKSATTAATPVPAGPDATPIAGVE